MTRAGQPIQEHPLREAIDTQIRYESLAPGLVPLYEEREAAIFAHYNWTEWRLLDWDQQAAAVGHYRIHRQVEMHQNDVIAHEMRKKVPKGPPGAR